MAEPRPLEKPAHLRPAEPAGRLAGRRAAALALALGALSFAVVAVIAGQVSSTPDAWLSLPGLAAAAGASVASIARREPRGYRLWLPGLGLAAAAVVLGWFLLLAIVIGAAIAVITILHAVM